ncbi:MAG: biotin--[acetyl-CoA-carboxylase] ligase [Ignavibacteria bacterium]|nr:biotin--[acetyl-CoA-carboxylase] ligase [Ignavibacteria bacterium]
MDTGILQYKLVRPGLLKEVIWLDEVNSTNEYAAARNLGSDSLVITDNQTGGKGRFGRVWHSTPGKNIAMSLVKSFRIGVDEVHNAGFYTSLKLLESLLKTHVHLNDKLALKWPNDLMINGRKTAGLLMDCRDLKNPVKKIILGIGLNVNESEFHAEIRHKATSLFAETGSESDLEGQIVSFINEFYSETDLINDTKELMGRWKSHCCHIGMPVRFRLLTDGEEKNGIVKDIGDDGSLKLETEDGKLLSYYSGEISLLLSGMNSNA